MQEANLSIESISYHVYLLGDASSQHKITPQAETCIMHRCIQTEVLTGFCVPVDRDLDTVPELHSNTCHKMRF